MGPHLLLAVPALRQKVTEGKWNDLGRRKKAKSLSQALPIRRQSEIPAKLKSDLLSNTSAAVVTS
jgi:hypothetical protein